MRLSALATLVLGTLVFAQPAAAQPQWQRERATWLQQHTAAAANGVLGLTTPWWRPDCRLVLGPNSGEQRTRVYALSAVRRVEPDATHPLMIQITFAPEAPLGVVQVQSLFEDRTRVIERIQEYATACAATRHALPS